MNKTYKHQSLCVSNQQGMAALLTVVIIASATLIMAFNASLLGLGELDLGYTMAKGGKAMSVASACVEEAMRQLRFDPAYSGGSLNVGDGSCIISIGVNGNDRTIITIGTVDKYNKKIQATATLSGANTIINTWQELSD